MQPLKADHKHTHSTAAVLKNVILFLPHVLQIVGSVVPVWELEIAASHKLIFPSNKPCA